MSLVLVADDEPAVLEVLTEVVEDLGHEVVRAHDGREALMLARAQQPNLVVTDHMMPRLSGVELCRALRGDVALREVPVILLSAALPPEANEANAYLAKPFELDEFEALVKRTLDGAPMPTSLPAVRPPRIEGGEPPQELINWVAHEMKTPLAAAKMNLQLLERRIAASAPNSERHHFASLTRQLENLEQIVNAMLDASRLSEGRLSVNLERRDLRDLVHQVVAQWRELHPDFQFELLLPEREAEAKVDPARTAQIISILLSNAVRYANPPKHVRIQVDTIGSQAEVHVQDFGPGISAAAQKTLFKRFRPSDERGKEHGLGLYIASGLARLHGGSLSVRSSLGQGATFTLSVPQAT